MKHREQKNEHEILVSKETTISSVTVAVLLLLERILTTWF